MAVAAERMSVPDLVTAVDLMRREATDGLAAGSRGEMGQFMTPPPVATLMASMFGVASGRVRLLDPGPASAP